jgi:signal transduction histidine kinase
VGSCSAFGAGVVLACLAGCVIALSVPFIGEYSLAPLIMLETAGAVAAWVATGVLLARARDTGARSDLSLALAAASLAATSLLLFALPTVLRTGPTPVITCARASGWLASAALFASAGWVDERPLHRRPTPVAAAGLIAGIAVATALAGALVGVAWPRLLPVDRDAGASILAADSPALLFVQLAGALLFALAALGFSRRWRARRTGLTLCIATACALAACTRIDFLTAGGSWIVAGTLLRTLSLFALATGAAFELRAVPQRAARRAVASERARLARELHDGMAQELAYIVRQSTRLARQAPPESDIAGIAIAAQRALEDSRASIEMLSDVRPGTLAEALARRVHEIARRAGIRLALEIPNELPIPAEHQHDVLRVVAEAVNNVANHADASTVIVAIDRRDGRTVVRVSDDGCGFNPSAAAPGERGGRGLPNMTHRAHATGAELRLESTLGEGTTVELALP